jgi:hypothetical protein
MTDSIDKRSARRPSDLPRRARASASDNAARDTQPAPLCWPFPAGSQNDTDKAVKLKPYVPPKRRTLNQF